MPLLPGSAKPIVGENIRTLMREGRPQAQSVAIAMRVAGKPRKKPKKKPESESAAEDRMKGEEQD